MMSPAERDALLLRLDERTARTERLLLGNGQPGLVTVVAGNAADIKTLKANAPSPRKEKARDWGLVAVVLTGLGALAKGFFGV